MSRGPRVGVKTDTGVQVHCAAAYGDYHTLCGMDADDPAIGHLGTVEVADNAKIDCPQCKGTFLAATQYRSTDFSKKTG